MVCFNNPFYYAQLLLVCFIGMDRRKCKNDEGYLVKYSLLFTPVSITPLIDTEDARFDLNASRPIAKGDLKMARCVTGRTSCEQ